MIKCRDTTIKRGEDGQRLNGVRNIKQMVKPICRPNQKPILDICLYEVEFTGGEITEMAANIIAESTYAQYDSSWNEYLLLEVFIDHRKND